MNTEIELYKQHSNKQEKYVYYIIALSVASIGFSVHKTTGVGLDCVKIPLGIAIVCWGLSIYCGLRFLKYVLSNVYANIDLNKISEGRHSKIGTNIHLIEAASSGILEGMNDNGNAMKRLSKWQELFFYFGIIFFLTWHILEMYNIEV